MSKESDVKYRVDLNGAVILEEPNDEDTNISITETFSEDDENNKKMELILEGVESLTTKKISRRVMEFFSDKKYPFAESNSTYNNFKIAGNENIVSNIKNGFVAMIKKIIDWCKLLFKKVADFLLKLFRIKRDPVDYNEEEKLRANYYARYTEMIKLIKNLKGLPPGIVIPEIEDLVAKVPVHTRFVHISSTIKTMFNASNIDKGLDKLNQYIKALDEFIETAIVYLEGEDRTIKEINSSIDKIKSKVRGESLYTNDLEKLNIDLTKLVTKNGSKEKLYLGIKKIVETTALYKEKITEDNAYKVFAGVYRTLDETTPAEIKGIDENTIKLEQSRLASGRSGVLTQIMQLNQKSNNKVQVLANCLENIPHDLDSADKCLAILQELINNPSTNGDQKRIINDIKNSIIVFYSGLKDGGSAIRTYISLVRDTKLLAEGLKNYVYSVDLFVCSNMIKTITTVQKDLEKQYVDILKGNANIVLHAPIVNQLKNHLKQIAVGVSGNNERVKEVVKAAEHYDLGNDFKQLKIGIVNKLKKMREGTPAEIDDSFKEIAISFLSNAGSDSKAIPKGAVAVRTLTESASGLVGDLEKWKKNLNASTINY